MVKPLVIASWNINGRYLTDKFKNKIDKVKYVIEWAITNEVDIVCLQETHSAGDGDIQSRVNDHHIIFESHNNSSSTGVATIFINYKSIKAIAADSIKQVCTDHELIRYKQTGNDINGRILHLEFKYNDKVYNIINLYCPATGKVERELFFKCHKNQWVGKEHMIMCGDFNTVVNDFDSTKTYTPDEMISNNIEFD